MGGKTTPWTMVRDPCAIAAAEAGNSFLDQVAGMGVEARLHVAARDDDGSDAAQTRPRDGCRDGRVRGIGGSLLWKRPQPQGGRCSAAAGENTG